MFLQPRARQLARLSGPGFSVSAEGDRWRVCRFKLNFRRDSLSFSLEELASIVRNEGNGHTVVKDGGQVEIHAAGVLFTGLADDFFAFLASALTIFAREMTLETQEDLQVSLLADDFSLL